MHVVIFEGLHWKTFAPLSLSRPVFTLATGTTTLLAKQIRHSGATRLSLWVRPEMAEFVRQRVVPDLSVPATVNTPLDDEPALLLSGRTLHFQALETPAEDAVVLDEGDVVRMARVTMPGLSPADAMHRSDRWLSLLDLPQTMPQTRLVEHLSDLIKWNEESLLEDYAHLGTPSRPCPQPACHLIDAENIWFGADVKIDPGTVLDASRGPVMLDHHCEIGANAVLQGPCYVGPHSQIAPLTLIRPGTTIGPVCKVGGEVAGSVILGYSNKAHDGYLGDSYVGKWVNLGAGTATSNLKNTYGTVSIMLPSGPCKTGRRFLGSFIADHVKTAIGTRLMAGSYVGFASMLAGSTIAPRFVPSYTFWTDKGMEPYRMGKAIEVMKTVFARRDRTWEPLDSQLVEYVAAAASEIEAPAHPGSRPK